MHAVAGPSQRLQRMPGARHHQGTAVGVAQLDRNGEVVETEFEHCVAQKWRQSCLDSSFQPLDAGCVNADW